MSCAWNALDEFENLVDYDVDSIEKIEKLATRIADRYKVRWFWNEYDEVNFAPIEEGDE